MKSSVENVKWVVQRPDGSTIPFETLRMAKASARYIPGATVIYRGRNRLRGWLFARLHRGGRARLLSSSPPR